MKSLIRYACLCLVLLSPAAPLRADEQRASARTADWMVDLARDAALRLAGAARPADLERVRLLLTAAARLVPDHFDAHRWLYELAVLSGDQPAADAALDRLRGIAPEHEHIFALWLARGMERLNTAEQRQGWLGSLFDHERNPRNLARIHAELARFALQQSDHSLAQRYLVESRALCPECPEAPLLAVELLAPDTPPLGRLDILLDALTADPLGADLALRVADVLDELRLPDLAEPFYRAAREMHRRTTGLPLPASDMRRLALNALARGDAPGAIEAARVAMFTDRETYESAFLLAELFRMLNKPADAMQIIGSLRRRFEQIQEPRRSSAALLAQAAWFHCVLDPQHQRALLLAEEAVRRAPTDPYVQRVHGWALALNDRHDEAAAALAGAAPIDAEAAYMLARVRLERADEGGAARALAELRRFPPAGPTRMRIGALPLPAPADDVALQGDARTRLERFDHRVLEFHAEPQKFIAARIRPVELSPRPGHPWEMEFAVRNIGPFPITLGAGGMVHPSFTVSIRLDGDEFRDFPHLITVEVDQLSVLAPGQTASVVRTLDVGPPRRVSRRTPQQLQRVIVSAIFDPERTPEGEWRPSFTGQEIRPLSFNRIPALVSPEAWNAYRARLTEADPDRRRPAVAVICDLLAERQRADAGRLNYSPQPIPAEAVRRLVLESLSDPSWAVRVAALEGLRDLGLDADMLQALEQRLSDDHWAVRMMAVLVAGERRIDRLNDRVESLASNDGEEIVRRFAKTYSQP